MIVYIHQQARMVELVDTLVSGTRARKGVQVQVLFRAKATQRWVAFFLWFCSPLFPCTAY